VKSCRAEEVGFSLLITSFVGHVRPFLLHNTSVTVHHTRPSLLPIELVHVKIGLVCDALPRTKSFGCDHEISLDITCFSQRPRTSTESLATLM
jgi:hypothetical protein